MNWKDVLPDVFGRAYQNQVLPRILECEWAGINVYPPKEQRFRAFEECPWEKVKVVIIGQDPYHTPGKANGLAFDCPSTEKVPPSLKNILTELDRDVPVLSQPLVGLASTSSYLGHLPQQGVLLINTALSVVEGQPESHMQLWAPLIEEVVKKLNEKDKLVWMLWGNHAKEFKKVITNPSHLILEAGHPSPFSVKLFKGCSHFSKANAFLESNQMTPIYW